jgi:hypothetical protein
MTSIFLIFLKFLRNNFKKINLLNLNKITFFINKLILEILKNVNIC